MAEKKRLDVALTERGLAPSREKAKLYIREKTVYLNGKSAEKAGQWICDDDIITLQRAAERYVSRGGLKLEKALAEFGIALDGLVCLDVGASTGGFTDCMLQHGAQKVWAVDVGHGQLAEGLQQDARVVSVENCNFRYATGAELPQKADFASVDVSFISLRLILPVLAEFLHENASAVCLVKPQFEAGRGHLGKNGVVKDARVHARVLTEVGEAATACGFAVLGQTASPILGQMGNTEFLLYLQKQEGFA